MFRCIVFGSLAGCPKTVCGFGPTTRAEQCEGHGYFEFVDDLLCLRCREPLHRIEGAAEDRFRLVVGYLLNLDTAFAAGDQTRSKRPRMNLKGAHVLIGTA